MVDCGNVEMRELLPEHMHGTLDAATRARVEAHLAGCAPCRDELALLRRARVALGEVPRIDHGRIAGALSRAPRAGRTPAAAGRWSGRSPALWRLAAAIVVFAVGGASVFVADYVSDRRQGAGVVATGESALAQPSVDGAPAGLSFGGGFADLSDAQLEELLGDIDEVPLLPGLEPEAMTPPLTAEEES